MTRQKNDFIEKINKAALKFLSPLDTQETYKVIVKEAIKLISGNDGLIILRNGRKLCKAYVSTVSIDKIPIRKKGFIYTSLTHNKVFLINTREIKSAHPEVLNQGIKSGILIPLTYQKNTIGVLMIRFKRAEAFTTDELKAFKLFGSMATLAIKKTQLYAETKKAVETRDLFISLASHELKTPLTSIRIYSQLLNKKLTEEKHPSTQWAEKLLLESNRLILLVNELLAINQIKSGHFNYEWKTFDLKEVIRRAITNSAVMYPSVKIIFQSPFENKKAIVSGDFNKLMQVIINLLNNAAKFSSSGETVTISLDKVGTNYTMQVIDKGKGIPKEDLDKIFDRFYKGAENYEEGMGLGLFLTKKIIEDHKGKIYIVSEVGKGTTVSVQLPKG